MVNNQRMEIDEHLYFGLLMAATLATCFMMAETRIVVSTVIVYLLFAAPGVLYFSRKGLSNIDSILYGIPLGLCVTGLMVMASAWMAKWSLGVTVIVYLILLCTLALGTRAKSNANEPAYENHALPRSVFGLIFVFVLLIFIPLLLVGRLTPDGYAFTGLFGHDFILRAHYSVALARAIPPDNFFFEGQLITNYYLLWYMLPATVYKLLGMSGDIRKIVSLICILNVPVFFLLLFRSLAGFVQNNNYLPDARKRKILSLSFGVILFSYSYHWAFFLFKKAVAVWNIEQLNSYADQMGFLSQSWFRAFLFEPQLVLALMMMLLIIRTMKWENSWSRGVLIGIVLSGIALSDLPAFFVFGSAYFLFNGWRFIRERETMILLDAGASAVTGFAIAVIMVLMGILSVQGEYSNSITIKPYIAVIVLSPVFLMLHFGGAAVTGVLGMIRKARKDEQVFMLFLAITSLFFMFFVTEMLDGNAFLRKSIQIIRLPIALFTGYYLVRITASRWLTVAIIALLVLAVPTVLTDVYAVTRGAVPEETTYIKPAEIEAASWLRDNTADTSVVQSLIDYPGGRFSYSLTVCFGERKAALAYWKIAYLLYPNVEAIGKRVRQIETIFETEGDDERYNAARDLKINYLFIGDKERRSFPGCEMRIARDGRHFRRVFGNEEVRIYEVLEGDNNT